MWYKKGVRVRRDEEEARRAPKLRLERSKNIGSGRGEQDLTF